MKGGVGDQTTTQLSVKTEFFKGLWIMTYYDEEEFYDLQEEVIELRESQESLITQLAQANLALAKIHEIIDKYYACKKKSDLFEMSIDDVKAIGKILEEYENG